MTTIAYNLLEKLFVNYHSADPPLARAIGRESKGWISAGLYLAAIGPAFIRL